MSETILVGLIAGSLGVLAAAVPAYFKSRNAPSRRVSDTAAIVDASGQVITTLRQEIDRLDSELDEARAEAKSLRMELEERPTKKELLGHIARLEAQLRRLGETPVNGVGPR
jgi:TolA-binding protein